MDLILVTGGVHADVGKGCAAAVIGRALARGGRAVDYRKLEPCVQGPLATISNHHFGEIVVGRYGAYDGDVARAAFFIPRFQPVPDADFSLRRALDQIDEKTCREPSPRLLDVLGAVYRDALVTDASFLVLEVGGTAGEPEHRLLLDVLARAFRRPSLHVHVTTIARGAGSRRTTKPAQNSLAAVPPPDLVLVRSAETDEELAPLVRVAAPGTAFVRVSEDERFPERAYQDALQEPGGLGSLLTPFGARIDADPLFASGRADECIDVQVLDDGAGPSGYSSLVRRLVAWSRGRIRARFVGVRSVRPGLPLVRIGENAPPRLALSQGTRWLEIVPIEAGRDKRDPAARPDWVGNADHPEGAVAAFVEDVLDDARCPSGARPALAYEDPQFAAVYTEASRSGRLRDHGQLDAVIQASLPPRCLVGGRVLDLGCGDGRWADRLLGQGVGEVVGVEVAGPMADRALARRLPRFTLIRGRAEDVDLPGTFDAAIAVLSLDHVEQLNRVLARVAKSLQPHGRLVIAVEHPMRSAPRTGPRWIDEEDGSRASRIRDYGVEGFRSFAWFEARFAVGVYHRTFATWVAELRRARLELLHVREPVSEETRDGGNPRFLVLVAESRRPPDLDRSETPE
jgi:SAM-dependent methyltransferase